MATRTGSQILMALWGLFLGATAASAQTYPSRPIRMIVPIAPGSVTDVAARLTAQELSDRMGQPVIVENRPGANMVIGGAECAKAAPDGYTLCVVSPDTMSFNPFTVPNLPYDPDKDFRPVTNMYYVVEGLVAKQALAANSVDELRALAAARPDALNFGTLGARTTTDMYRLWLGELWKTSFVGVPYKGGSEIIAALLAGTIDVSKIGVGNMAGQLDEKKLKVLALRSSGRNARLPDVPTLAQAGLAGFPGGPIFWGLVVPTATPDDVVKRIYSEVVGIIRGSKFGAFAQAQFIEPEGSSPEQFAAFLKEDRVNAGKLLKSYGAEK
jgi:tripartite-type tricarboxylate transporter receptor subunit TctC